MIIVNIKIGIESILMCLIKYISFPYVALYTLSELNELYDWYSYNLSVVRGCTQSLKLLNILKHTPRPEPLTLSDFIPNYFTFFYKLRKHIFCNKKTFFFQYKSFVDHLQIWCSFLFTSIKELFSHYFQTYIFIAIN